MTRIPRDQYEANVRQYIARTELTRNGAQFVIRAERADRSGSNTLILNWRDDDEDTRAAMNAALMLHYDTGEVTAE